MINKLVDSVAEALEGVRDGSTVLLGGFGEVGLPIALVDGLIEQGARDLTVVANNAGTGHVGLARLMELARVRKVICSFPRSVGSVVFERLYREGKIELEIVPQGTLVERMRAAGAGVTAFYTPTAVGTKLGEGKEVREIGGKRCVLEEALYADVALVEAWRADRWGNLTYKKTGRNYNPVMATAAKLTIVQTNHMVELGDLDPESIVTPGIFVHRVVHVPDGGPPVSQENPMPETPHVEIAPLNRAEMAGRVAANIPEGWYVNLGLGIPTLVGNHVPLEREVIFHSENGILGMGPAQRPDAVDRWLINAGKQHVTLRRGGAFFDQAESFGMIRGGHLDLSVLGAFEVAENGDIANWATSENGPAPAVGGAMDVAVGAKRVWVVMEHTTKDGRPRLVRRCSYPLTAVGSVNRVYTNLAVLDVTPRGFVVLQMIPGMTLENLQARTEAKLFLSS